jgi:hypothetical protein
MDRSTEDNAYYVEAASMTSDDNVAWIKTVTALGKNDDAHRVVSMYSPFTSVYT